MCMQTTCCIGFLRTTFWTALVVAATTIAMSVMVTINGLYLRLSTFGLNVILRASLIFVGSMLVTLIVSIESNIVWSSRFTAHKWATGLGVSRLVPFTDGLNKYWIRCWISVVEAAGTEYTNDDSSQAHLMVRLVLSVFLRPPFDTVGSCPNLPRFIELQNPLTANGLLLMHPFLQWQIGVGWERNAVSHSDRITLSTRFHLSRLRLDWISLTSLRVMRLRFDVCSISSKIKSGSAT